MFDFRYHAVSLVAVLVALAVGLLLGVAIGDSGLVSSAERDLRASLRRNVVEARGQAADARRGLAERRAIEAGDFFPLMVGGRLPAARIGLIGLGDVDDATVRLVQRALENSGGRLASVSVVGEPPDLAALAKLANPARRTELAGRPERVGRLARRVGVSFVQGSALLRRVRARLLRRGTSSGALTGVEGVVLVRSTPELTGEDATDTTAFEDGLVRGLVDTGVPVVGVQTTAQEETGIRWFQQRNLASVDDLDLLEGRAALVLALAGEKGSFGVKPTADALLPSVVPPGR